MGAAFGAILGQAVGVAISPVPIIAVILMSSDGAPSTASGWVKVVIGALFVALGIKQWRNRPKPGETASVPAWMATIDEFTAAKAFGAGLLLSG